MPEEKKTGVLVQDAYYNSYHREGGCSFQTSRNTGNLDYTVVNERTANSYRKNGRFIGLHPLFVCTLKRFVYIFYLDVPFAIIYVKHIKLPLCMKNVL